ncbi:MAG: GNAT family N-acetyltransferase [Actinomycetota bacterium]
MTVEAQTADGTTPPEVLVPFEPDHGPTVVGWPRSRAEIDAWCGLDREVIEVDQLIAWAAQADVLAFVFCKPEDGEPLGYGELWLDDEEAEVELGRLIVDPAARNRAVGRRLVIALAEVARHHFPTVVLRVRRENRAAIACYRRAGFTSAASADQDAWNVGQPQLYLWMQADDGR